MAEMVNRAWKESCHSVSGNLRLTARLRTNLLQVPGWMLGIMQTTLFFIPHWIRPKPFCVWQLSAPFVSLQVSSVLEGRWRLETGTAWRAPSCGRSMGRHRITGLSVFWRGGVQSQDSSFGLGAKGRGDESFQICRPLLETGGSI